MHQTRDESGQQQALSLQDFRRSLGEGVGMWIAAGGPSRPRWLQGAGGEHWWMRHTGACNVSPLKCGPSRGFGGQPSFGCERSAPHWPPQQTAVDSRRWALNPGRCLTSHEAGHMGGGVKGAQPSSLGTGVLPTSSRARRRGGRSGERREHAARGSTRGSHRRHPK
jgi:hypothetical protein